MKAQATRFGWILRIDPGEEIVETLRKFAKEQGVRAGLISGLGAVGETELGFFVRDTRQYVTRRFEGEHEIGSLTGNFSELDGQAIPHCHAVIAGEDMVAHTGHLFRGVVTVTCEVAIVTDPEALRRLARPDLGFNPIEPSG
ncbi:MAG TPA: PPC domain-containing DNA-binding protein [Candidatus Sulfotelmatobacter sp.]|nr:PPC domain-containing DNA-binding protein [Candidatus Sulfotelmatobacter sp.]